MFADISPITDYSGHLSLEFVDFTLCADDVKYTIPECKERDATYAVPLRVTARLINRETGEIKDNEVYMGDFPKMTESGTFVIKLEHVRETGKFLIEIMPLMFIPAGVGLMSSWSTLKPLLLPVAVITVVTIVTVMVASGHTAQFILKREEKREGKRGEEHA